MLALGNTLCVMLYVFCFMRDALFVMLDWPFNNRSLYLFLYNFPLFLRIYGRFRPCYIHKRPANCHSLLLLVENL